MDLVSLNKIKAVIQSNGLNEDFSEVLKSTDDYDLFYHLSDSRMGIVNWYPFNKGTRILEVNAELGAVTGALLDSALELVSITNSKAEQEIISLRYRQRKNFTCVLPEELNLYSKKKFDYIVYIGGLENFYKEYERLEDVIQKLTELKSYLKPEGIFLLAVENRYGIDNWIGKKDSFTGIPFDAINNYVFGSNARSFTKLEIEDILKELGYIRYKFYYPLPDYKTARIVYTDRFLPEADYVERLNSAYSDNTSFIADYKQIYNDLIESQIFCFFSNSYLVEMTNIGSLASANYITTSYKRGRKKAFSVIVDDKFVSKKCCFADSLLYAHHICNESEALAHRGIPVVAMTMTDSGFVMPCIKAPTLQSYIRELAQRQDVNNIFILLNKLWQYILNSSDYTEKCAFDVGSINVGPVLKKAFIEMIPLNCFYDKGKFIFFDQEFAKENYPARYIMARCIRYLYWFIPEMSSIISVEDCYTHYDIDINQWNLFMSVDDRFLEEVNPYSFYNKEIDLRLIRKNQNLLLHSNHIRTEPNDNVLMRKVHEVQTGLIRWVSSFCEKHHLAYFCIYEPLLSAARGGSANLWNDVFDLGLKRTDYDLFVKLAPEELPENFFLQLPNNDCYFSGGHAILRNKDTTSLEPKTFERLSCAGIGINILPLDYGFKSPIKQKLKTIRIRYYQHLLMAKTYDNDILYKILSIFFTRTYLSRKLDKCLSMCDKNSPAHFGIYTRSDMGKEYSALSENDFTDVTEMLFDGNSINVPIGYEHFLVAKYGKYYMEYQTLHNKGHKVFRQAFYSTNVPYKNYQIRFFNLFKQDFSNKSIVLFGDGIMFSRYFIRYGHKSRFIPSMLVHTFGECLESAYNGIPVVELNLYSPEKKENIYPIICTAYIRETERIIRKLGFRDYYIFVDERDLICLEDSDAAYTDIAGK